MKREHRDLLSAHAAHFMAMSSYVREMGEDELTALAKACEAATQVNCGWDIYAAARFLEQEIKAVLAFRKPEPGCTTPNSGTSSAYRTLTVRTLERVYGHHSPDHQGEAPDV